MERMPEGQSKTGVERSTAAPDQSIKRGRPDGTDALAGRPGRMTTGYQRTAPSDAAPRRDGREIDPNAVTQSWVDGKGGVATSPVQDVTVRPDGTPKVTVEGGSSRVDQPGKG